MPHLISFFILILILYSCNENHAQSEASDKEIDLKQQADTTAGKGIMLEIYRWQIDVDTVLLGDMNRDGIGDTAIITSPIYAWERPTSQSFGSCKGGTCISTVRFSFNSAQIEFDRSIGFLTFFAVGDLNDDGIEEVAFIPNWFWSCWSNMSVYSLQNGIWTELVSGSVYTCYEEDFSNRVKKMGYKKFEFIKAVWNEEAGIDTDSTFLIAL
jgi:hypothetical protein